MGAVKDQLMEVEQFVVSSRMVAMEDQLTNADIIRMAEEKFGKTFGSYAGEVICDMDGSVYEPNYDTVTYDEFVNFTNEEIPF